MAFAAKVRSSVGLLAFLLLAGATVGALSSSTAAQQPPSSATAQGSIAGTVIGKDGAPVAEIGVQAYERVLAAKPLPFRDGEWTLRPAGAPAKTNAQGQYRLELPPGDYYVRRAPFRAQAVPATSAVVNSGQAAAALLGALRTGGEAFMSEFYPGEVDPAMVNTVHVADGSAVRGIDFTLRPNQTQQVKGIVSLPTTDGSGTGRRNNSYLSDVFLAISPIGLGSTLVQSVAPPSGPPSLPNPSFARTGDSGIFQVSGILPGAYRVLAAGLLGGRRVTAVQDFYVLPNNTPELTLSLEYGLDVQGQIRVNGQLPPGFQLSALRLNLLEPAFSQTGVSAQTVNYDWLSVNPDGSFVVRGLARDQQYQLVWSDLSDKVQERISDVRYGNKSIPSDGWIKATTAEAKLQITFDFGNGRVNLQVEDQGAPRPGAYVLLSPRDRRRMDLHARTMPDGAVAFDEVVPGLYEVFAFDNLGNGDWKDFETSRAFRDRGRGQFIRVEGGQTATESVPLLKVDTRLN